MSDYTVYNNILARRSIRRFSNVRVEDDKIDMLLKAAMAAPSACNLQPWEFIVASEPEALAAVLASAEHGQYNAPLAIVVCGVYKHIPWEGDGWLFDCGAAAQNIMLQAQELGLSSVCVGGFDAEALSRSLDIPDDVTPVCIIEIGYGQYIRPPHTWYTKDAVHYQKFDKNRKRTLRSVEMLDEDIKNGII